MSETDDELIVTAISRMDQWKRQVLDRDGSCCVNCEKKSRIAPCFIVPPEAGGRVRMQNGVTLCRDCRIATESARVLPLRIDNKTPINFLISSKLHEIVERFAHNGSKFGSISALVRRMIHSFINEPELYEDVGQWQDGGSDVKINGWVDGAEFGRFKVICQERGMTYTDTLKALLLMAIDGYENDNDTH